MELSAVVESVMFVSFALVVGARVARAASIGLKSSESGHYESGQATPEYALVILAAVALAAALIVWAKKSGAMAELFEFVVGKVKEAAGG